MKNSKNNNLTKTPELYYDTSINTKYTYKKGNLQKLKNVVTILIWIFKKKFLRFC